MTSLLSIVVLVLLAYTGSRFILKWKIQNTFLKSIAFTGIIYITLGYLLSSKALNIVTVEITEQLKIVFALVLGWAGFLIGLQTKFSGLKRFPVKYYRYSALGFLIGFAVTFLLLYGILNKWLLYTIDFHSLLILSLAGAVTSPIMVAVVVRDHRVQARLSHLLQFNAAFDNLLGVLMIGIIVLANAFLVQDSVYLTVLHGIIVLAVSIVAAGIYASLTKEKISAEENFLYVIGLLLFVVGSALYFGMSILLASMIFGIVTANISGDTRRLYQNIQQLEKPMYILLLIFAGLNLHLDVNYTLLFLFFLVHIFAKLIAEYTANYSLGREERHEGWLGFGNIGMGGLSLAIILDFNLIYGGPFPELLLIIITALFFQDGIALQYLEKRLIKEK